MARYSDDDYPLERIGCYIFTVLSVLIYRPYRIFSLTLLAICGIWYLETISAETVLRFRVSTLFLIITFVLTIFLLAVAEWTDLIKEPLRWPLVPFLISVIINYLFIVSDYVDSPHITSFSLLIAIASTLTSLSYKRPKKEFYASMGWPFAWYRAVGLPLLFAIFSWGGTLLFWFNIAFISLVLVEVMRLLDDSYVVQTMATPVMAWIIILLPFGVSFCKGFLDYLRQASM